MNCKHLIAAAAIAITGVGAANAQVSQESWGGPEPIAASPAVSTMTPQPQQGVARVEVQADWALWQRAGLGSYQMGERSLASDPVYQQRLAEYQRMRSGPEYLAEIQRLGGDVSTIAYQYERGVVPTTY